jgi:GTP-binding protein
MRTQRVEFMTSAARPGDFPPEDLPEIAMIGRSNVGKSSLINRLVGAKGIARVSSTPGKTRLINFYRVTPVAGTGAPFSLVDLPGYGYARISKENRSRWAALVEAYLLRRGSLAGVVVLLDLRHGPSPLDRQFDQWIKPAGIPMIPVVAKADLLTQSKRATALRELRDLGRFSVDGEAIFVSARTGEGKNALFNRMIQLIEGRADGKR